MRIDKHIDLPRSKKYRLILVLPVIGTIWEEYDTVIEAAIELQRYDSEYGEKVIKATIKTTN